VTQKAETPTIWGTIEMNSVEESNLMLAKKPTLRRGLLLL
jgi:hypothetical protein